MRELLFIVAAIWGISGAVVVVLFMIDERAHRRSINQEQAAGPALPAPTAPRPIHATHADHALA